MRLLKYRLGQRTPFTDSELGEACSILASAGGAAREPLTRPFGPDATITHRTFDFEHSGFEFTLDIRGYTRRGQLLFQEIDTDNAIFGCAAVEEATLLLMTQLKLVAQFSTRNEASLVTDAALAADLPAGFQAIALIAAREELSKAIQKRYAQQ